MKTYGGVHICTSISTFSWSQNWRCVVSFALLPLSPGTHLIRNWVGPRARLDDVEKLKFLTLPRLELRLLDRSASSQSLYRLRYRVLHYYYYYYYYYYYIMALQLIVGLWPIFQFLDPIHSWLDSLDEGLAPCKASTYTQDNTKIINAHSRRPFLERDSDPWPEFSSERRHSCLRPRGHCDLRNWNIPCSNL
jgi:hypothetical protein